MRIHGSCAARLGSGGFDGVLLRGPAGSGKSDLLIRLLDRGFHLVADDQVLVEHGMASAPAALAGMVEVRGLGLFKLPYITAARLRLVVALGPAAGPRLPLPQTDEHFGLPLITLDPMAAAAPERLVLALNAALGQGGQLVGAFAA